MTTSEAALSLATVGVSPAAPAELVDTAGSRLPLTAVELDADVCGLDVRLLVRQVFTNVAANPIEATYVFPLPPRAAVRSFTATFAGRVVRARVDERSTARREYRRAIEVGKSAALAEEDRPSTFTMTIGNIPPGAEVQCELECDAAVAIDSHPDGHGLEAQLRLPTVVAPRYTEGQPLEGRPAGSGVGHDSDAVPDASRVTPPLLAPGADERPRFTCRVNIDSAGLDATELACTVASTVERGALGDGPVTIAVEPDARLDRDVVFTWRLAPAAIATTALLASDTASIGQAGDTTWELTLLPPSPGAQAQRPRDVVVLLDRSGSMSGWKQRAACRAAARIVDALGADDRFAVLAFDDQISTFAPDWTPASDRHRFEAAAWCAGVEGRGGTELSAALAHAAGLLRRPDREAAESRDRLLVVLTDAQVSAEDQALDIVFRELAGVRVLAVGVDAAANLGLLDRLARSSGGSTEIVDDEHRLDAVLGRLIRRVGTPVVTDLSVVVPGADPCCRAPRVLPDLFAGSPVMVAGRLSAARATPVLITVTGRLADGSPWRQEVTALPTGGPAGGAVTGRWARARILDLEDGWSVGDGTSVEDIVALSTRCSVLSRFTAFIAVDEAGEPVHEAQVAVNQPVELPAGWDPSFLAQPVLFEAMLASQPMRRTRSQKQASADLGPLRQRRYRSAVERLLAPPSAPPTDEIEELERLCTAIDRLTAPIDPDALAELVATATTLRRRHGALVQQVLEALERLVVEPTADRLAEAKRAARDLRLRVMLE